jgi:LacI family transcriptional regulator
MHAIADAGLSVPHDVAIVGFDDIEAASLVRPGLSTMAQDPRALCSAAVDALLRIIDEGDRPEAAPAPAPQTLPTRLVVRASCGARTGPSPDPGAHQQQYPAGDRR